MAYTILITFTRFYLLATIVRGKSPTTITNITTPIQNISSPLDQIPEVVIEDVGMFFYIQVNVTLENDLDGHAPYKIIIRGNCSAEDHAEIFDEESAKLHKLGLKCECLGGGRIELDTGENKTSIYGFSEKYGQADHQYTEDVLKKYYPNYEFIISSEGY